MPTLDPAELRSLLEQQRPTTVLNLLGEDVLPELGVYKAEALLSLDRDQEAHDSLDPIVPQLHGDDFARAERMWAEILLRQGWLDSAILSAEGAARAAESADLRAAAVAWSAVGYARKRCWNPAENALREAQQIAPRDPLVLLAEARVRLEMDQRLEARAVYEQMAQIESVWARSTADWGRAHVAFLLGAFDDARALAEAALQVSDELIGPLFVLAQAAMATDDASAFERVIAEMERRSPQASMLKGWKEALERLKKRLAADPNAPRKRLAAFPTTLQRRDYCGPCTIELVLRYWQGGLDVSNDQIAQVVKFPGGGSPTYKMREFFHLVGFDTVRCLAPADKLKQLIDAGYPAIVQEEYSDSSHVAVVIGYDDSAPGGRGEQTAPHVSGLGHRRVPARERARRGAGPHGIVRRGGGRVDGSGRAGARRRPPAGRRRVDGARDGQTSGAPAVVDHVAARRIRSLGGGPAVAARGPHPARGQTRAEHGPRLRGRARALLLGPRSRERTAPRGRVRLSIRRAERAD
jgi:tetratricopeptide (TPR) repeat protein